MISVFIAVAALFASSVLALEENPCLELPPPGNGFVNDLRHCSQYFSCMSWLPFEMTCPYNFYFDPVRQVCDSPTNVQCSICRASGVHGVSDDKSNCFSSTWLKLCSHRWETHHPALDGHSALTESRYRW